jgi:hypothetical protein
MDSREWRVESVSGALSYHVLERGFLHWQFRHGEDYRAGAVDQIHQDLHLVLGPLVPA